MIVRGRGGTQVSMLAGFVDERSDDLAQVVDVLGGCQRGARMFDGLVPAFRQDVPA